MIDIFPFTNEFLSLLSKNFGDRIFFVGLQGSYARGEATENSDIDMVVILDSLTAEDIAAYSKMLDTLPNRELMCGFLSGKRELLNWEPSDLFQFYYDTKALYGSLDELMPLIDMNAVERAIKIGVCNIYHTCVHNMIYDKREDVLIGLYKSASFVIQAIVFKQTGKYIRQLKDLCNLISDNDKVIVDTYISLKNGCKVEFNEMSTLLFAWAQKHI